MLASDLSSLRKYMMKHGILFSFSGYITEEILSGIGSALKRKLAIESANRQTVRGLFSIFVELVQNVIRYSAEKDISEFNNEVYDLRYGVLAVGKEESKYFISCGNIVENKDVNRLRKELELIQSLDKDDLKDLYKETLRKDSPEHSIGAGVGFIEIARKSEQGFEFDFCDMKDGRAFFSIRAFV